MKQVKVGKTKYLFKVSKKGEFGFHDRGGWAY